MADRKQLDISQSTKVGMAKVAESVQMPQTSTRKAGAKNEFMERENQDCYSVVLLGGIFILTDVWKQVATYGMKFFNDNRYPLPQTQVIAMTEMMKLLIFVIVIVKERQLFKLSVSPWLMVPSVIFAINNNIYLLGLHYTTPPVWNILIQFRILFTALTYRILFKRILSFVQWISLAVLIIAIVLTNFSADVNGFGNISTALILAVLGSMSSVVGSITMEYRFKNDKRSFSEMQLQLYFFGSIASWLLYFGQTYGSGSQNHGSKHEMPGLTSTATLLMVLSMVLSVGGGIVVATIVKKLDNIVKLYLQALANMLTSVACWILFPEHFQLNVPFIGCLVLMFLAIFGYENQNICMKELKECIRQGQFYKRLFIWLTIILTMVTIVVGLREPIKKYHGM